MESLKHHHLEEGSVILILVCKGCYKPCNAFIAKNLHVSVDLDFKDAMAQVCVVLLLREVHFLACFCNG